MANYKQVEEALKVRKPFTHQHSMRAIIDGNEYRVFSYSTLIATHTDEAGWWLNENKYTVTTSKQQNILRRVIGSVSGDLPAYPN